MTHLSLSLASGSSKLQLGSNSLQATQKVSSLFWKVQDLQPFPYDQSLTRSLCPSAWCPSMHYDLSLLYSLCSHPLSPCFDQLLLCLCLLDSTLPFYLAVSLPSGFAHYCLALKIILGPSLLWQHLSPQGPSHHASVPFPTTVFGLPWWLSKACSLP